MDVILFLTETEMETVDVIITEDVAGNVIVITTEDVTGIATETVTEDVTEETVTEIVTVMIPDLNHVLMQDHFLTETEILVAVKRKMINKSGRIAKRFLERKQQSLRFF